MFNILVAGGFDSEHGIENGIAEFGKILGSEIIRQGHTLVNSCRTELDRIVAEGANEALLKETPKDNKQRIVSYVMKGQKPVHNYGTVRQSRLDDWELGSPGLTIPEPISMADVIILIGGYQGTHRAANWARITEKPLLPISRFEGAAREIYYDELDRFSQVYSGKIDRNDYENLSDVTSECVLLAQNVISLAERVKSSNDVFVIMSFSDDPDLEDAYETYKTVCEGEKYICRRVDDESDVPRILPEILSRIQQCAFSIVDLSDEKVNVYYELGYAEAARKPIIVTAKEGTQLPFDVKDIPVIFWKNQKGLREQLSKKIKAISSKQGR